MKYLGPWCLMPTQMKITQVMRARIAGLAMRALAGMWKTGMTSKRLPMRMKKNRVARKGR